MQQDGISCFASDREMTEFLSIESYAMALNDVRARSSNRIWEAFQPNHFTKVGYPSTVSNESELYYFADAMRELGFEHVYGERLGGLTEEEFSYYQVIARVVAQITTGLGRKAVVPKGSFVSALVNLRYISALVPAGATIFEVGPGSGYLGALLGLAGYRYIGIEVSQGFYLWQNRFWRSLFNKNFHELATREEGVRDCLSGSGLPIIHAPWWKFGPSLQDYDVDLTVACASLAEMHYHALLHFAACLRGWFSDKGKIPCLLVEGYGDASNRTARDVDLALRRFAIEKVYSDQFVNLFVHSQTESSSEGISENSGSNFGELFMRLMTRRKETEKDLSGEIDKELVASLTRLGEGPRVSRATITEMFRDLTGEDYPLTDDETFWKLIYQR